MRERKKDFDDYLCKRMDAITNAAHELIIALTGTDCSPVEWDMQKIGPIADCAEEILIAQGVYCCYPGYDENETPCFLSDGCTNPHCPLKAETEKERKEN